LALLFFLALRPRLLLLEDGEAEHVDGARQFADLVLIGLIGDGVAVTSADELVIKAIAFSATAETAASNEAVIFRFVMFGSAAIVFAMVWGAIRYLRNRSSDRLAILSAYVMKFGGGSHSDAVPNITKRKMTASWEAAVSAVAEKAIALMTSSSTTARCA
jgi:hypothetical protein